MNQFKPYKNTIKTNFRTNEKKKIMLKEDKTYYKLMFLLSVIAICVLYTMASLVFFISDHVEINFK